MSEDTTEATKTRGRPRPEATLERDKQVLAALSEHGPQTRAKLAKTTGLEGSAVYLSLWRLSRSEPAQVVKNGSTWSIPGQEAAQAEAPAEDTAVAE